MDTVEDNWNSIVLAVATTGGYLLEKSSKKMLCISEPKFNSLSNALEIRMVEYEVTATQYKNILKDVQRFREEIYLHEQEQIMKNRETARKRAATRAKNKKIASKTTKTTIK